jgi:hypothetical protein
MRRRIASDLAGMGRSLARQSSMRFHSSSGSLTERPGIWPVAGLPFLVSILWVTNIDGFVNSVYYV